MTKAVFCLDCGRYLGEYRPFFAKEHLKQFPKHRQHLIKTLIDPLLISNPDEWFGKHPKLHLRFVHQPIGNTEKSTDKETAPVLWFCQVNGSSPKFFSL